MTGFSPEAKILLYLALVIALFLFDQFMVSLLLLVAAIIIAVRVPFSTLKRGMVPILIFLLFTFLSNLFFQKGTVYHEMFGLEITDEGLARGGLLTLRLFTLILGAKILTATTEADELVRGMTALLGPAGKIGFVSQLMITMLLTLRFLPIVYDEAIELYRDVKNSEESAITGKIKRAVSLLAPLFERSLQKAREMAAPENEYER